MHARVPKYVVEDDSWRREVNEIRLMMGSFFTVGMQWIHFQASENFKVVQIKRKVCDK